MALDMAVCGLSIFYASKEIKKYTLVESNPFSYQQIDDNSLFEMYRLNKTKNFIKINNVEELEKYLNIDSEDNKKILLLYNSIIENNSLTLEEKIKFAKYMQYVIDNDFLDYEYVWNKFITLKLDNIDNPNDYKKGGIGGTYQKDKNQILFQDKDARNVALTHETFHAEDKSGSILDYGKYSWFIEGLTSVLNYEYFDERTDGYDIKADFIRILCELVGPNVLLKVRSTGDMEILFSEFENKNIDRQEVEELFDLINEYNFTENRSTNIRAMDIIVKLEERIVDISLKINNNFEYFNPLIFLYLRNINNSPYVYAPTDNEKRNIYYFNSSKIDEKYIPNIINYHQNNSMNSSFVQAEKYEYYKDKVVLTIYECDKLLDNKEDIINNDRIVKVREQVVTKDEVLNYVNTLKNNHEMFLSNVKK